MKQAYNAYCFWLEEWKNNGQDISQFDDSHEECFQAGYIAGLKGNSPESIERKNKLHKKANEFVKESLSKPMSWDQWHIQLATEIGKRYGILLTNVDQTIYNYNDYKERVEFDKDIDIQNRLIEIACGDFANALDEFGACLIKFG